MKKTARALAAYLASVSRGQGKRTCLVVGKNKGFCFLPACR